jgi:hypothetical protein
MISMKRGPEPAAGSRPRSEGALRTVVFSTNSEGQIQRLIHELGRVL